MAETAELAYRGRKKIEELVDNSDRLNKHEVVGLYPFLVSLLLMV